MEAMSLFQRHRQTGQTGQDRQHWANRFTNGHPKWTTFYHIISEDAWRILLHPVKCGSRHFECCLKATSSETFKISTRNFMCTLKWPSLTFVAAEIHHFWKSKMVAAAMLEKRQAHISGRVRDRPIWTDCWMLPMQIRRSDDTEHVRRWLWADLVRQRAVFWYRVVSRRLQSQWMGRS